MREDEYTVFRKRTTRLVKRKIHLLNDYPPRYTVCGLRWESLSDDTYSKGKVTCRNCLRRVGGRE